VNWLQLASNRYESTRDTHRQAVTCWMQYIVQRAIGQYQRAFDRGRRARRLFSELADESLAIKKHADESWYRNRIVEMTGDLVSSPEDAFELLFEFHGTLLSASSAQVKARLAEYLERRLFDKVSESMQLLLGTSFKMKDPLETGEVLAYCGVIHWVLENRTEATNYFRSAMTQFIPGSHEHALARWMLGLALFAASDKHDEAISHMETSIEHFDCLRQAAIHKNDVHQRDWYAIHHIAMKRVLRTKIGGVI
jgi:hypothetical protein